jgi:hypothetical protein
VRLNSFLRNQLGNDMTSNKLHPELAESQFSFDVRPDTADETY